MGKAIFYSGEDDTVKCAFSDASDNSIVAVMKADTRRYTYFPEEFKEEPFGKAAVASLREDRTTGYQIDILFFGGLTAYVRATDEAKARQLAALVEKSVPKLSRDEKMNASDGECKGPRRNLGGRELSTFLNETAFGGTANYATSQVCALRSESGDISIRMFGNDMTAADRKLFGSWRTVQGGVLTNNAWDVESPGEGYYRMALQTKSLGFIHIDAYYKNPAPGRASTARGMAGRLAMADQLARVKALAELIAQL